MTTIHIPRGLPASGKTTFALRWVAEDPEHRARLNRDEIRAMVHAEYSGYDTERVTTVIQHNSANALLRKGFDLILDDTNLGAKFVKDWLKLAERQGATVEFHDQFLDVPAGECVTRDALRISRGERGVGEEVIRKMHMRYLNNGPLPRPELTVEAQVSKPYTGTPGMDKAVICDIDGTLALNTQGRSPYDWSRVSEDAVNQPVADIVWMFENQGYDVVFMSGRDEACRDDTFTWLVDSGIGHNESVLLMRRHDDNRKDSVIKLELFDQFVRDSYDVRYVIDDRNQVCRMWRELGLTVLQVAEGDF